MAKLPPIVDDAAISAGALNHARYLVKNGIGGGNIMLENGQLHFQTPQDAFRWEDKGRPFFTDNGAAAGRNSVVLSASAINLSGADLVDLLMTMPFSGMIPMVPQFSVAGLGAYCDPGLCAIVTRVSVRAGEIRAHRALRRTDQRPILEPESRADSGGDRTLAHARRISARRRHHRLAIVGRRRLPRSVDLMSRLQSSDRHSDLDSIWTGLRRRRQSRSVVAARHA